MILAAGGEGARQAAEAVLRRSYGKLVAFLARTRDVAGARDEARGAYDLAIGLEGDPAVRAFLLRKRSAL